jgi:two-component system response regulator FixJ
MKECPASVFVVDANESVRTALQCLLAGVGLPVESFSCAQDFLKTFDADRPGCVVLDIRLPGMSGLALQQRLTDIRALVPVLFITGHGDVPMAIQAMQNGAVDFIQRPFRDDELLDRIARALEKDRENRVALEQRDDIRARMRQLSPREREILGRLADGQRAERIAAELDLNVRSVEIHRARLMETLQATSLAHLMRMAAEAERVN